jgi:ABC-type transport system substrate-binding protein
MRPGRSKTLVQRASPANNSGKTVQKRQHRNIKINREKTMTNDTSHETVRPVVAKMAEDTRAGKMSRREFVALASTFGASATAAYGLLGLAAPTPAHAQVGKKGGVLRVASRVMDITDPRKYAWTEPGNLARQFCEPLVRWASDFSFQPMLLEGWEVSDDAKTYTLKVRQNAVWNNGDAFNADDVIHNLNRWCDKAAEGNSMASRMGTLIDPETNKAIEGAIERVDDFTVRLNLPRPDITIIAGMSDYPALCVHRSFDDDGDLAKAPIGTGPFELVSIEIGVAAEYKRREDGKWWGGDVYLDGIRFIDFGEDNASIVAAFDGDEIDINDESTADFIESYDAIGLIKQSKPTANTIVARMRADAAPYDSKELRNAIQLACDNAVLLAISINGEGIPAENHHVAPCPRLRLIRPRPSKWRARLGMATRKSTSSRLMATGAPQPPMPSATSCVRRVSTSSARSFRGQVSGTTGPNIPSRPPTGVRARWAFRSWHWPINRVKPGTNRAMQTPSSTRCWMRPWVFSTPTSAANTRPSCKRCCKTAAP